MTLPVPVNAIAYTCGLVRSNLPFAIALTPHCSLSGYCLKFGAHDADRTHGLSLTKGVLYH